jgi:hypothetical protein
MRIFVIGATGAAGLDTPENHQLLNPRLSFNANEMYPLIIGWWSEAAMKSL